MWCVEIHLSGQGDVLLFSSELPAFPSDGGRREEDGVGPASPIIGEIYTLDTGEVFHLGLLSTCEVWGHLPSLLFILCYYLSAFCSPPLPGLFCCFETGY